MSSNVKEYVTVQELEQDLLTATGNPSIAKNQAAHMLFTIEEKLLILHVIKKGL